MPHPLNINLYIPFKDNKGARRARCRLELETFREEIIARAEELKEEVGQIFARGEGMSMLSKSDGNSKKYYWRIKAGEPSRRYFRLAADEPRAIFERTSEICQMRLIEIEQEIISLNANLRLVKGMLDSIDQYEQEQEDLQRIRFKSL